MVIIEQVTREDFTGLSAPGLSRETGAMVTSSISRGELSKLTAEEVAELANRLERDEYSSAFDGLEDWHLLRTLAFERPELIEPYIYLLDLESYDEA
jgi:hypothetical protein